jgi:hypothetical protein
LQKAIEVLEYVLSVNFRKGSRDYPAVCRARKKVISFWANVAVEAEKMQSSSFSILHTRSRIQFREKLDGRFGAR